jgi:hypothetical protein
MGLRCVSMLVAAELLNYLLWVLRLSPSTLVALAQGLLQISFRP